MKFLFLLILFTNISKADEGIFEKQQNFMALAFGPKDEACEIVANDIEKQMRDAEDGIEEMGGIIINEIVDPCIYSENMQTSMFGEMTYLIPDSENPQE